MSWSSDTGNAGVFSLDPASPRRLRLFHPAICEDYRASAGIDLDRSRRGSAPSHMVNTWGQVLQKSIHNPSSLHGQVA